MLDIKFRLFVFIYLDIGINWKFLEFIFVLVILNNKIERFFINGKKRRIIFENRNLL